MPCKHSKKSIAHAWKTARHQANELIIGTETEMKEHGMTEPEAKKTALEHLKETPDYYSRAKAAALEAQHALTGFIPGIPLDKQPPHVRGRIAENIYFANIKTAKHGECEYCGQPKEKHREGRWCVPKSAQHTGIASVPQSQKLSIDRKMNAYRPKLAQAWKKAKTVQHGTLPEKKVARHQICMEKFAEVKMKFLREGNFKANNGKEYFYPWEVVKQSAKSFEGKDFYLNHTEEAGTEYGIIASVYPGDDEWLHAMVHIPEANFTDAMLKRIQTGLMKPVSSTHAFITDKSNNVKRIDGMGISAVTSPEVEGAEIESIRRNVLSPEYVAKMKKQMAMAWKKAKN